MPPLKKLFPSDRLAWSFSGCLLNGNHLHGQLGRAVKHWVKWVTLRLRATGTARGPLSLTTSPTVEVL